MSNGILMKLLADGWEKENRDEVKIRLFRDVYLIVWAFDRRLTTNIASEDAEPIFLPTLSSENADDSYIEKINTLKNLLLATDRDESEEW